MSQPDLFVVCKNCGSEVSPYVTECPYCGQRVRKRAPKLERGGEDAEPRVRQRRRPRLSRLRTDEIEGIAPETRPVLTMVIIVASLLVTLVLATDERGDRRRGRDRGRARRRSVALCDHAVRARQPGLPVRHPASTVGIFGSLLERRFGWFCVLFVFLAAGAAGAAAAVAADLAPPFEDFPIYAVLGANGAALGLLAAWYVDDRRAARRGDDRESDLLGVYVIAAVLLLLPLAVTEASVVAGVTGGLAGALLGLALPLFTRR